ncbi:MAG: hypothetical protein BWK76_27965 [Desulfobulbaceae bacterium A2]|nr:MAG: hypothetical protein BWK76_27965 [Desulfobulbaceae bacterium A2]
MELLSAPAVQRAGGWNGTVFSLACHGSRYHGAGRTIQRHTIGQTIRHVQDDRAENGFSATRSHERDYGKHDGDCAACGVIDRRRFVLCCASALFACGCGDDRPGTSARLGQARKGLDATGRMQVSPEDRCGLCGMVVERYQKFAAAIALDSGDTFYFCGTQCMLRAWLKPEIFLGSGREHIARVVVTDYFSGRHIDGATAIYVRGSDVLDPMGPGLIALAGEQEAQAFIGRHGGEAVVGLDAISESVWQQATGKQLQD